MRILIAFVVCALCGSASTVRGQEPGPRSGTIRAALASYAVLSGIDAAQTTRALASGQGVERNPVLAPFADRRPVFLAVKAAATAGAVYAVWKVRARHPKLAPWLAVGLAAGQAVVVASNARQLRKGR